MPVAPSRVERESYVPPRSEMQPTTVAVASSAGSNEGILGCDACVEVTLAARIWSLGVCDATRLGSSGNQKRSEARSDKATLSTRDVEVNERLLRRKADGHRAGKGRIRDESSMHRKILGIRNPI